MTESPAASLFRVLLGKVISLAIPLVLAGVSLAADVDAPQSAAHSEDEIKCAMLYNFTRFVEWPAGALGEDGAPLVVGVLGGDALVQLLEAALRNKSVSGHPLAVHRLDAGADPKKCHVLFVCDSERARAAQILQSIGRSPTLTIGERVQFSRQGGVIAFIRDGNRIRFEINLDAADRAGFQISSKLLRLATIWRDSAPQVKN
jgi:hypothetical protein